MKVKLAFSVATSVSAEILIVDEVLAVGDLAFQRKCFNRMEDIIKRQGRTVLLVSHNIRQVERLCKRVMMLEQGRVVLDSEASATCRLFYERSNETISKYVTTDSQRGAGIRSTDEIKLLDIDILDNVGQPTDTIFPDSPLSIRVRIQVNSPLAKPELVIGTHTTDFFYITSNTTATYDDSPDLEPGEHVILCTLDSLPLSSGVYCIRVAVFDQFRRMVFFGENLRTFTVQPKCNEAREAVRLLDLPATWEIDNKRLVNALQ
jgi:hypothetical protein